MSQEKLHIEKIFQERARNDLNSSTLANTLDHNIQTVFNSPEKFVLELLQNADDASLGGNLVDVSFLTKQGYLLLSHNGKHFDDHDVEAICDNAQQRFDNKRSNSNKTGYKGIGFKSVFVVSDCVYVISKHYIFRFDRHYPKWNAGCQSDASGTYPWQIIPIWTELDDLPQEIKIDHSQVNFLFKLGNNFHSVEQSLRNVQETPNMMLFLRNIQSINFNIDGIATEVATQKSVGINTLYKLYRDDILISQWLIIIHTIYIPQDIKRSLQLLNTHECPEKLKQAQNVIIKFALQVHGNNSYLKPICDSSLATLFCYLPTNLKCGLPFLTNADFLLTADRMQFLENDWNQFLFRQIGMMHIETLSNLAKDDQYRYDVLDLFTIELQKYFLDCCRQAYADGVAKAMKETAFIPSYLYSWKLLKFGEAVVDKLGFYRDFSHLDTNSAEKIAHYDLKSLTKLRNEFTLTELAAKIETYAVKCQNTREYHLLINTLIQRSHNDDDWMYAYHTYRYRAWKPLLNRKFLLTNNNRLVSSNQVYLYKNDYQIYPSFLDFEFIDSSILNLENSRIWLEKLEVKEIDDDVVVEHLIQRIKDTFITEEISLEIVKFLCQVNNFSSITREKIDPYKNLKLLTKSNSMIAVEDCYLPSVFDPCLDLESLISKDIGFLSDKYYSLTYKKRKMKQFFKNFGVPDDLHFYNESIDSGIVVSSRVDDFKLYHDYIETICPAGFNQSYVYPIVYLPYMSCLRETRYAEAFFQKLMLKQDIVQQLKDFKINDKNCNKIYHNVNAKPYLTFMLNNTPCIRAQDGNFFRMKDFYVTSVIKQLGEELSSLLPRMQTKFDSTDINLSDELMVLLGARNQLSVQDAIKLLQHIVNIESKKYFQAFKNLYKVIIKSNWNASDLTLLRGSNIKLLASNGQLQDPTLLYFISMIHLHLQPHHSLVKKSHELNIEEMQAICRYFQVSVIDEDQIEIKNGQCNIDNKMKEQVINLFKLAAITVDGPEDERNKILTEWLNILQDIDFTAVTNLRIESASDQRIHFQAKAIYKGRQLLYDIHYPNYLDRILDILIDYLKPANKMNAKYILSRMAKMNCDKERLEWLAENDYDVQIAETCSLNIDRKMDSLDSSTADILPVTTNDTVDQNTSQNDAMANKEDLVSPSEVSTVDLSTVIFQEIENTISSLSETKSISDDLAEDQPIEQLTSSSIESFIREILVTSPSNFNSYSGDNIFQKIRRFDHHWSGRWGEEFAYRYFKEYYKKKFSSINHEEETSGNYVLAGTYENGKNVTIKVIWCNHSMESGKPMDLQIVIDDYNTYIEVKSTYKSEDMLAKISKNEWRAMRHYAEQYELFCVYNAGKAERVRVRKIKNPAAKLYNGEFVPSAMYLKL